MYVCVYIYIYIYYNHDELIITYQHINNIMSRGKGSIAKANIAARVAAKNKHRNKQGDSRNYDKKNRKPSTLSLQCGGVLAK